MSRYGLLTKSGEEGFPRSRGDEPVVTDKSEGIRLFSPLTRG